MPREAEPRIPWEELSEPEKELAAEQETRTDALYRAHVELAGRLKDVQDYLPAIQREAVAADGTKVTYERPPRWDDIAAWQKDGTLLAKIEQGVAEKREAGAAVPDVGRRAVAVARLVERGLARQVELAADTAPVEEARLKDAGDVMESLRAYKAFRLRELAEAKRSLAAFDRRLAENRAEYDALRREGRPSPALMHALEDEYANLHEEKESFARSSPEVFLWRAGNQLAEAKRLFDAGGHMVETPYVKRVRDEILQKVSAGQPVFLHGELGSGKTELAVHVSRLYLSASHLRQWEAAHPAPSDQAKRREWLLQREAQREPIVVRGARGTETEELLGGTTLKRREPLSPERQAQLVAEAVEQYQRQDPSAAETEIADLRSAWRRAFENPVEAQPYVAGVGLALETGRPVVIDEMDAIPHYTRIQLNHLLTRKPGDLVDLGIEGKKPFRVPEGFAVLATGNWHPKGSQRYVGREAIDAAYLSRWGDVHYDYLPMNTERATLDLPPDAEAEKARAERAQNELLQMIVVRLLDKDLSVQLPAAGFDQLYRLTFCARIIQDVATGRQVRQAFYPRSGVDPRDVLKENILSLRHLLPIVDTWRDEGYTAPLDYYLFTQYVQRSSKRPEEMLYLYGLLRNQGGFFQGEAWPDPSAPDAESRLLDFVHRDIRRREQPSFTRHTPVEVIEKLYGPIPGRQTVRRSAFGREDQERARRREEEQRAEAVRALQIEVDRLKTILQDPQHPDRDPDALKTLEELARLLPTAEPSPSA